MYKLFGLLFGLVGLVYFSDALPKSEAYSLVHDVGNDVRQEYIAQLKSTIKQAFDEASSADETACIKGYVSNSYKELNTAIGGVLNGMRSEYRTKSSAKMESETEEQLRESIQSKVRAALKWFPDRIKKIKECTEE